MIGVRDKKGLAGLARLSGASEEEMKKSTFLTVIVVKVRIPMSN